MNNLCLYINNMYYIQIRRRKLIIYILIAQIVNESPFSVCYDNHKDNYKSRHRCFQIKLCCQTVVTSTRLTLDKYAVLRKFLRSCTVYFFDHGNREMKGQKGPARISAGKIHFEPAPVLFLLVGLVVTREPLSQEKSAVPRKFTRSINKYEVIGSPSFLRG